MTDIGSIAAALSSLKNATDLASAIKASGVSLEKAEAKMQLADLILALAEVKIQLAEVQQSQVARDRRKRLA